MKHTFFLHKILNWFHSQQKYVVADPADNSVTLSPALFRHIRRRASHDDAATVFVFRIPSDGTFAFTVNPKLDTTTQLCNIQYNQRYRCIGFETLCPSVGRIFYDYGISPHHSVKLPVSIHRTPQGLIYYKIINPHSCKAC